MPQPAGTTTATASQLAAELSKWGDRQVTPRNVKTWHDRRATTGFPEIVGQQKGYRAARLWDVAEVLIWYLAWEPGKGGAPVGNLNAFRHGGYVGRRAARQARQGEADAA